MSHSRTRLSTEAMLSRIRNVIVEMEQAILSQKKFSVTKIYNNHKFFGGAFSYALRKLGIVEGGRGGRGETSRLHLTEKYKELYPTEALRRDQLPLDILKYLKRFKAKENRKYRHPKRRKTRVAKAAPVVSAWPKVDIQEENHEEQIVLDLFENDMLILILKGVVRGNTPPGLVGMAKDMLEKLEAL